MALVALAALVPFYIMIVMGTHENETLYHGMVILPGRFLARNIRLVMESGFLRFYGNSMIVSAVSTVISVFVSSMAGYSLALYRFRLRKLFSSFVLVTMMVPPQLGIIAYVVQMRMMGLTNTLLPLVFWWAAYGFGVFLMAQFMRSAVPLPIIESARMDGCGEFSTFLRLALPLSTSAVVTLATIVFVLSWNNYLLPLVLVNRVENYTVPLGVALLGSAYRTNYTAMTAGLMLGTIPVLVIFIMGSGYFIRGMTAGALKE